MTERRTNAQTHEQMNERTKERTNVRTNDERTNGKAKTTSYVRGINKVATEWQAKEHLVP